MFFLQQKKKTAGFSKTLKYTQRNKEKHKGKYVLAVYYNIQKAFDPVDHKKRLALKKWN